MTTRTRASTALLSLVLAATPLSLSSAAEAPEGFRSLFDGISLAGWDGDPQFWGIEEGAIVGQSSEDAVVTENTFLIWQDGELDDFDLQLKFKIDSGNSGVQVRSFLIPESEGAKHAWRLGGYQADIEAGTNYPGLIYGEKFRGILSKRGEIATFKDGAKKPEVTGATGDPEELLKAYKLGEWNEMRVVAKGHTLEHYLNGKLMAVLHDEDVTNRRRSGLLGFQMHQGDPMKVHFKDIFVKRLPLEDVKKVVFLAGNPSHGLGAHEHNAGCLLLANALNQHHGDQIFATVYQNGWPNDASAFDNADSLVMYCDGGGRHFAKFHLRQLDGLHQKGIGMGAIHYGVEIPKGEGLDAFTRWMGGGFETNWSVNPHWDAAFETFPEHPVANGLKPFTIRDEWYFHMRFREDMKGVTPILSAVAPEETMSRKDGAHSGNPTVRKSVAAGDPQHLCWVSEAADAGRGFGFTGGHFHSNWNDPNFRMAALNAIGWISGLEVPAAGFATPQLSEEELNANLDPVKPKPAKKPKGDKKKPAEAPKKAA